MLCSSGEDGGMLGYVHVLVDFDGREPVGCYSLVKRKCSCLVVCPSRAGWACATQPFQPILMQPNEMEVIMLSSLPLQVWVRFCFATFPTSSNASLWI